MSPNKKNKKLMMDRWHQKAKLKRKKRERKSLNIHNSRSYLSQAVNATNIFTTVFSIKSRHMKNI